MKKRTSPSKNSDKEKKKETVKRVKTAPATSEKTSQKKKVKTAPRPGGRTAAGKSVGERKKKVQKAGGKERKETAGKKISPKPENKTQKVKTGRPEKKGSKTEVSTGKKAVTVARAGSKKVRTEQGSPARKRDEIVPGSAGRVRIRKTLTAEAAGKIKAGAAMEARASVREKTSGRIVEKRVESAGAEEIGVGAGKSDKSRRPQRPIGTAAKTEEAAATIKAGRAAAGRAAEEKKLPATLREAREEAERPLAPRAVLPEEYGENSVTLMTVDPYRLFAFWEVREETLKVFSGEVDIRVYDVTGIDFDRMDANDYFDVRADARIGKCYVSVRPEREYIADVGIVFDGIFIAISRSARVSTPRAAVSEEGILLSAPGEAGLRTGY